jgi:predicted anti-sigma-YlaC factor YlaD
MSMHGLIRQRLEDYLRDAPGKQLPGEFEQHLRTCEECRGELSWMQEQCRMLRTLRPTRTLDPPAGFYARVMERIEAQQGGSFWNVFLDPVFGRRLVAASLTLAVLLVGFFAFAEVRTDGILGSGNPEAIMAVQQHPPDLGVDQQRDRDTMLVTLATYSSDQR